MFLRQLRKILMAMDCSGKVSTHKTMEHYYVVLTVLILVSAGYTQGSDELLSSACYGTSNNFLELNCSPGEVISVTQVLYGSKLKGDNCPVPTVNNDHAPSCCYRTDTDCVFSLPVGSGNKPDPYMKVCAGLETCSMRTLWLDTAGHCTDQHMAHTNFMQLSYVCRSIHSNKTNMVAAINRPTPLKTTTTTTTIKTTKTLPKETTTSNVKHKETTTTTDEELSQPVTSTTPFKPDPEPDLVATQPTALNKTPSPASHVEISVSFTTPSATEHDSVSETSSFAFTTGMMGGMTAAIAGLILTIIGFLFYWGRRKRKTVTVKPNSPSNNSTVWDFLLAHTVAARTLRRGYDNFSNNGEAATSEVQQTTAGKQTWLPNIHVEPNLDTQSVTSDENCSIVNINILGSMSSRSSRSEV